MPVRRITRTLTTPAVRAHHEGMIQRASRSYAYRYYATRDAGRERRRMR